MKTQTAVEYLISELPSIDWENSYWKRRLEKAKEIEKHQKGYSEEEVLDLVENFEIHLGSVKVEEMLTFKKWFKQRLNSKLDKTFIPKEIDMLELGQIIPKEEEEPKFVTVNIESATGRDLGKVSYIPLPNIDYIPKETLEEAAREYYKRGQLGFEKAADTERAFLRGGLWQQKQISKLRDELYSQLPSGEVSAFDLLKIIKSHIKKLDEL